jgi:hypothetical protein
VQRRFDGITDNTYMGVKLKELIIITDSVPRGKSIKDALTFYLTQFEIKNNVTASITVLCRPMKKYYGLCSYEWVPKKRNNIEVLVELDSNMSKKKLLKILAHELVHAKQFMNRTFIPLPDTKKHKDIGIWEGTKVQDLKYADLPWEIEAVKLSKELYKLYKNKVDTDS